MPISDRTAQPTHGQTRKHTAIQNTDAFREHRFAFTVGCEMESSAVARFVERPRADEFTITGYDIAA